MVLSYKLTSSYFLFHWPDAIVDVSCTCFTNSIAWAKHHLRALSLWENEPSHYSDVIMGTTASQITSFIIFLPNRLFRRKSKQSKLRITIHRWPVNSPHKASNAENVSIWWRHHAYNYHRLRLTHWGRVTHICVGKLTIIGSDNGLSPQRRQAIIWTNAGILLIGPLGTNFSEISIGIQTFAFKKMHFKMSSAKWRPFCLGLNVLRHGWIMEI